MKPTSRSKNIARRMDSCEKIEKVELILLQEWESVIELKKAVYNRIAEFNNHYLHSAHHYKPPVSAEKTYQEERSA